MHWFKRHELCEAWLGHWDAHVGFEILFWRDWLAHRGGPDFSVDFANRLNPSFLLQDLVAQHVTRHVHILDVGSGPLTWLGKLCPPHTVNITAVDALAHCYDLEPYNPPVRPETLRAECLVDRFPYNHFDVVFARNSIDHCIDPVYAIEQMVAVCRPGGTVVLEHHECTGSKERGCGLHQWDFAVQDGHMTVAHYGRPETVSLGAHFQGVAESTATLRFDRFNWVSARLKKLVPTL